MQLATKCAASIGKSSFCFGAHFVSRAGLGIRNENGVCAARDHRVPYLKQTRIQDIPLTTTLGRKTLLKHRKPISAVMTDYGWLVVICDDGSAWYKVTLNAEDPWSPMDPPIPGTRAAETDGPESAVVREYAGAYG